MKHEPRGVTAPPPPEGLEAEMEKLELLTGALLRLRSSLGSGGSDWQFPPIDEWKDRFESLEDAMPFLATLKASRRYLWWIMGDVAEGLMRRFGRTEGVKASIGSAFGCKVRSVEYRAQAAVQFPPETRYPDVPTELYREALRELVAEVAPNRGQ